MVEPFTARVRPADAQAVHQPVRPPVGDWLVVPCPPAERGWRWGRIVAVLPGEGSARFRVRWVGNDRDSVVVPPPGYRVESAARWPQAPSSAVGLWPHPTDRVDAERGPADERA